MCSSSILSAIVASPALHGILVVDVNVEVLGMDANPKIDLLIKAVKDQLGSNRVEFRSYWVLYIDLVGFSETILNPAQRNELARVYQALAGVLENGMVFDLILDGLLIGVDAVAGDIPTEQSLRDRVASSIQALRKAIAVDWNRRLRIFSDSMFIFLDDDVLQEDRDLTPAILLAIARWISTSLWALNLPHRGAVTHGDCFLDKSGSVFLGEPIVRASRLEHAMELLAIAVDPSALRLLRPQFGHSLVHEYTIPTKHGPIATACVAPFARECEDAASLANLALTGFQRAYDRANERSLLTALPKYVNTLAFFKSAHVVK